MLRVPAVFEAEVKWNLEEVEDPFLRWGGPEGVGVGDRMRFPGLDDLEAMVRESFGASVGELVVQGFTDSLVNTHVIDHYMSTAFLLSVVLMELAVQLGDLGTTLQLGWTPREQNEEADALSSTRT